MLNFLNKKKLIIIQYNVYNEDEEGNFSAGLQLFKKNEDGITAQQDLGQ